MEARSRQVGLQHRNSVVRAVFLSKGQACRGFLPNEDFPDQVSGHGGTDQLLSPIRIVVRMLEPDCFLP